MTKKPARRSKGGDRDYGTILNGVAGIIEEAERSTGQISATVSRKFLKRKICQTVSGDLASPADAGQMHLYLKKLDVMSEGFDEHPCWGDTA